MNRSILSVGLVLGLVACSGDNNPSVSSTADGWPEPSSTYQVIAQDLSLSLQSGGQNQSADTDTWNAVVELLPSATLREQVAEYHVFSDGVDETLAYVSQLEGNVEKWLLAVDSADARNKDSVSFVTTVTHEFAHILALNSEQLRAGVGQQDCAQAFWVEEGCPLEAAVILAFYKQFWGNGLYAEHQNAVANLQGADKDDAVAAFYDRHQSRFINEYSATDPVEDFAESFSYFVFLDPIAAPSTVREEKIQFFHGVPALLAVRAHIRAQTAVRRESLER